MSMEWYLVVSALIFSIGAGGVLVRRNPLVILLCLELMLNAGNLALLSFRQANEGGALLGAIVVGTPLSDERLTRTSDLTSGQTLIFAVVDKNMQPVVVIELVALASVCVLSKRSSVSTAVPSSSCRRRGAEPSSVITPHGSTRPSRPP